jgi:hypothetical protein
MNTSRFIARVTVCGACGVFVVSAVPGFAQSNTRAAYSSISVVNLYDASRTARYDDVTLPLNLTVTSLYRAIVQEMLDRSPTFRRQCARIATARSLTIEVVSAAASPGRRAPAWSLIERQPSGILHAVVSITPNGRVPELIAHELEHVIEQLDGVDLSSKSRLNASGVRHCDCGDFAAFETTRAIHTGQKVAREVDLRSR